MTWGGDSGGITRTGVVAKVLPAEVIDVTDDGTGRVYRLLIREVRPRP